MIGSSVQQQQLLVIIVIIGYGWEGIRQVCATLLGCLVRAMYLSASAVGRAHKGAL